MERSALYIDLQNAIEKWAKNEGTGFPQAYRDALTDLRHMADDHNIMFNETLKAAKEVYFEERELENEAEQMHS